MAGHADRLHARSLLRRNASGRHGARPGRPHRPGLGAVMAAGSAGRSWLRGPRPSCQGAAHASGLALAPEYLRVVEVTCPAAEVVEVGGDAGAAGLDGAAEDGLDRRVQAAGLGQGEGTGLAGGVDAGVMQGLVGVDVADAGGRLRTAGCWPGGSSRTAGRRCSTGRWPGRAGRRRGWSGSASAPACWGWGGLRQARSRPPR
jgi:hypothetical protein